MSLPHHAELSLLVETGEEGEHTIFSCRAKLFHFNGQEWKERGVGTFKVNITETETETSHYQKARLIMRTDGVHRVVLNTPVFKGMKFGSNDGKEPSGKMINLAGMENGRPVPLLLKVRTVLRSHQRNVLVNVFTDWQRRRSQRSLPQNRRIERRPIMRG